MRFLTGVFRLGSWILIFLIVLDKASKIYTYDLINDKKIEVSASSISLSNGYVEEYEENGYIIAGTYKDGILDGNISISDKIGNKIYVGHVQNGIYAGYGQIYYYGKNIYEGRFKNGLYSGYGIENNYDNNGNLNWIYRGQFKEGHKNGYGVLEIKEKIYSGEFYNDTFDGKYYNTVLPLVPNIPSLMMEPTFNERYEKAERKSITEKFSNIIKNVSKEIKNNEKIAKNNENNKIAQENTQKSIKNVQYETNIKRKELNELLKSNDYHVDLMGNNAGNLMLDENVKYEDICEIIARIVSNKKNENMQNIKINYDIDSSEWAQKSISYLKALEIIDYNNNFDYKKEITREELYKILNKIEEHY